MKTKYNSDFPLLAEGYAREGLNDIQIAEKLGIGKNAFYKYIKKYKDFRDALRKGKAPVDIVVENSLLKRANGFEHSIDQQKVLRDGTIINYRKTSYYPPDPKCIEMWLSNRKRNKWRKNPDLHEKEDDNDELLMQIIENQKRLDQREG